MRAIFSLKIQQDINQSAIYSTWWFSEASLLNYTAKISLSLNNKFIFRWILYEFLFCCDEVSESFLIPSPLTLKKQCLIYIGRRLGWFRWKMSPILASLSLIWFCQMLECLVLKLRLHFLDVAYNKMNHGNWSQKWLSRDEWLRRINVLTADLCRIWPRVTRKRELPVLCRESPIYKRVYM